MSSNQLNVLSLNTSSTNVTTGAYVQLTASGGTPIPTSKIVIVNNTSSIIKLAYGAAGSETDLVAVLPTSQLSLDVSFNTLAAGTRLALEAVDADASTKYIVVSLLP